MAAAGEKSVEIHRLHQYKYVDDARWLPSLSALDRFAALAVFDSDSGSSSIEIYAINRSNPPSPTIQSSWTSPSRLTSLRASQSPHKTLLAAATLTGSLHLLFFNSMDASLESELSVPYQKLHGGRPISCFDLQASGSECLTVEDDGKVMLVSLGESKLECRPVHDSNGLVSYNAVKWASPTEFVTGGSRFGLQWWDLRKPGGSVSELKSSWAQGGLVHSIDIHPSRKHTCVAAGSSGTVFSWDLRSQQQPIILSGNAVSEEVPRTPFEGIVWEVQYDPYVLSSNRSNFLSSRLLPVLICSEDGFLAGVEQGEEPVELLAEPCAVSAFDIDTQNPSGVICCLEWESIVIVNRP